MRICKGKLKLCKSLSLKTRFPEFNCGTACIKFPALTVGFPVFMKELPVLIKAELLLTM